MSVFPFSFFLLFLFLWFLIIHHKTVTTWDNFLMQLKKLLHMIEWCKNSFVFHHKEAPTVGEMSAMLSWPDVCLFVTEATHLSVKTSSEQGSYANPLCQITAVTAESFVVPVLDVFLTPLHGLLMKSQPVMRDTALEFGPPSGTGKLIPLLLDAGTSSCTRLPPPTDGIFPHLAHSHTSFTAQVWLMS